MYPVFPVAFNSSQASNVAKNSLRIYSSNGNGSGSLSTYLSKTFTVSGDCKKWTYSTWYKPSNNNTGGYQILHAGSNADNRILINTSISSLVINQVIAGASTSIFSTSGYYFDPTNWYHLVVNFDCTQVSASDRLKLYINGIEQTELNIDRRGLITNTFYFVGSACRHHIGGNLDNPPVTPSSSFGDYYITETTFVDGLQLDASYFGVYSSTLNTWIPKKYNGNFGINGFYLNYSDTSNIGKDFSGLNNNFTANNVNTTSPLSSNSSDITVDVPGNYGLDTGKGGEVKSNYSNLNFYNKHSTIRVTQGALSAYSSTDISAWRSIVATMGVNYGKWYCEFQWVSGNVSNGMMIGTVNETFSAYEPSTTAPVLYPGYLRNSYGYYGFNGQIYQTANTFPYGNTYTLGDIIGLAMDIDNRKIYFSKNGVWQNSGNPELGTNPAATLSAISATWFPAVGFFRSQSVVANFGQKPFAYTAPIGFKSFCNYNLVEPIIKIPNQYFRAVEYTGANSTVSYSTSTFSPDLAWIKNKGASTSHLIIDTTRGSTSALASNDPGQQTFINGISFTVNGVSLPTGNNRYNNILNNYISWNFKKGKLPGVDIVSYRGTGTASANVNHSLQAEPSIVLIKSLSGDAPGIWSMWHKSTFTPLSGMYWLTLNSTNTAFNPGAPAGGVNGNPLGNSRPTSSTFNVGNNNNPIGYTLIVPNGTSSTDWRSQGTNYSPAGIPTDFNNFIAYLFTDVDGFSRFNSYTGNGLADGPFVWCGFKPALIIVKSAIGNIAGNWAMYDNARSRSNANNFVLYSNLAAQQTEYGSSLGVDILSNGFKIKGTSTDINAAQNVYIFLAFAELPAKYSLAK